MAQEMAGKQAETGNEMRPYRLRDRFLSAPELLLYRALQTMAVDKYVVFAKVALDDIFSVIRPNENVHYYSKLFRKHIDFLLCDPAQLRPQIGVELVRSLSAGGTRAQDQFIEDLFLTAGIPLVQVPAADHYEISYLVGLFRGAVNKARQLETRINDLDGDSIPMCPVCGKLMVLRTHRAGSQVGQLYYGCIDNPTCPGTVAIRS